MTATDAIWQLAADIAAGRPIHAERVREIARAIGPIERLYHALTAEAFEAERERYEMEQREYAIALAGPKVVTLQTGCRA